MTAVLYDLSILQCPRCSTALTNDTTAETLVCGTCHSAFPVVDGIPILLTDPDARTKLEDMDYDEVHGTADPAASQFVYERLAAILDRFGAATDAMLEIGAGTGLLTRGLLQSGRFGTVHVSDISLAFLRVLKTRMSDIDDRARYYVFDANAVPFQDASFDVIVGNSVLHHFLDYADTLAACYRLLREGGLAVFCEPAIQGKIIVGFMVKLMLELEQRYELGVFDEAEQKKLRMIVSNITKAKRLTTRKALSQLEDKYIFDIPSMTALGRHLGFSTVECLDNSPSGAARGYKQYVKRTLLLAGLDPARLDHFDFLFESFGSTFSDLLGEQIRTPMVHFVFCK
jgi:ubiquinone/menaquinone biosynthesis C-methylase UbiE/uncharacterized protein YbaR (Trm112 family)